ncbi:hypothetical protein FYK55_02150 [Roseiconus nitratireducens]|uniref:Uncharacterized protein n=1 Tax=Roseiconus nitratireducens TaxID=2605748 RepID=A0A5M6DP59_9BACT|nr:hypothetical protein [Roseiconus nitratireducens]KAA5547225.1 hypothetical protein FYK55_02150 [Roseiconus nitratireducens]
MYRPLQSGIFASLALTLVLGVGAVPASAGGGSGWGWKKPMNKRMGLFYTSNRNANFSRTKRTQNYSHYGHVRTQSVPVYSSTPVTVPSTSQTWGVPSQVPQHSAPVVVQPSLSHGPTSVPTTTVPPTSAAPVRKVQPRVVQPKTMPSAPVTESVLPHQSTTHTFWQ